MDHVAYRMDREIQMEVIAAEPVLSGGEPSRYATRSRLRLRRIRLVCCAAAPCPSCLLCDCAVSVLLEIGFLYSESLLDAS